MIRIKKIKVGDTIYKTSICGEKEPMIELNVAEIKDDGIMVVDANDERVFIDENCFSTLYREDNVWYVYCDNIKEIVGVYKDVCLANMAIEQFKIDDECACCEKMSYRILRYDELNLCL